MQLTPEQRKTFIRRYIALSVLLTVNALILSVIILADALPATQTKILGTGAMCTALLVGAMRRSWQMVTIALIGALVTVIVFQTYGSSATGPTREAGSEPASQLMETVSYVVWVVCPAAFGGFAGYFLRLGVEQMVRDSHASTRAPE